MDEFKPQKQLKPSEQSKPSEPGSTLLFWAESLTVISLFTLLGVDLDAQAIAAQTGNELLKAAQSRTERPVIDPKKSCPNKLVTNQVLVDSLINAGLPANATIIDFIDHEIRYYADDCTDISTLRVKYTGNGYLAVGLRAPTLPTKIKPKN